MEFLNEQLALDHKDGSLELLIADMKERLIMLQAEN
jgi:hypothetical protein